MELDPVEYPQPTVVPSSLEHIEVEAAVDCPTANEGPRSLEPIDIDSPSSSTFDPVSSGDEAAPPPMANVKPRIAPPPCKKIWAQPKVLRDKAFEVFCGAAGLTLNLTKAGFDALGVDHKGNKDKPKGRCLWIDLSTKRGQDDLRKMVLHDTVAYVHFAPPCGTASRARDRRRLNADGTPAKLDPKPLRSDQYPDGLPSLVGQDLERVNTANELYRFVAVLCSELSAKGIAWTVENPKNSRMWDTKWFRWLSRAKANGQLNYNRVTFDMCMHGGSRPKATTFLVSDDVDLSSMELSCDNSHPHKPWGLVKESGCVFATAEERNYPDLLCKRLAANMAKHFGVSPPKQKDQVAKVAANEQPRRRHPPLVPEYHHTEWLPVPEGRVAAFKSFMTERKKSEGVWEARKFPTGSKLLDVSSMDVGGSSSWTFTGVNWVKGCKDVWCKVGIGWLTDEFLHRSKSVIHPFNGNTVISPVDAEVLWENATKGPTAIEKIRRDTILKYTLEKVKLASKERELHAKLDSSVEKVVAEKNILLFKKMLEDTGYDDVGVHYLLMLGVRLLGVAEPMPFWATDHSKLPKMTPEMLWATAEEAQKREVARAGGEKDRPDEELWKATLEEVKDGNLSGPFTSEELVGELGRYWVPASRFGVRQNGKLRPVDNFSEHGVNATFGSGQKVAMKGLDDVVAVTKARLESFSDDRFFALEDDDGNWWEGEIHEEWSKDDWSDLVGRVADLKSAYKQLAVSPAHSIVSVISLADPDGRPAFFRAISLMFGASAAVYAFLRFSRALAYLGSKLLKLTLVEFFDDFSQVECVKLEKSAQTSFEALLKLLGWRIADTDAKRLPFAKQWVSLGVEVDFKDSKTSEILLRNKPGRIDNIAVAVGDLLKKEAVLGFKEALSLRGRVSFAEGYTHAKLAAPLARLLSRWSSIRIPRLVSDELKFASSAALLHLKSAGPRRIRRVTDEDPCLVFLDGACEEETSVGAVLINPRGENQIFGGVVDRATVESWKTKLTQEQVIGQAELVPLLMARLTWEKALAGRRVIFFMDNESARICAIRSYSPVLPSLEIVMRCIGYDYIHEVSAWYARVPTCCNVADGPSRMNPSEAIALTGGRVVAPICPPGVCLKRWLK